MPQFGMHNDTGKGPYRYQTANWPGSSAVNDGDFVFKSTSDHYDYSALLFTWNASLAQTQTDFKAVFRGVSTTRRTAAQTAAATQAPDGGILASGEFCFPCTAPGSAVYVAANSYVTIAQGTGNTLNPQKVVATTNVALAIGKLTRDVAATDTSMVFELMPATFTGGPQTNA
jgi:hypothetical protein